MAGQSSAAQGCDLHREGQILVPDLGAGAPPSNVVEADIPDACAGVPFELTAGDPADDLDVCWHAANGTELACFASPGNEAGTIPNGSAEARIDHFAGVDTTYTLRSVNYTAPLSLYFHDAVAPQGNAGLGNAEMDTSEPTRGAPASTYSIPFFLDGSDNSFYNAQWAWEPNTNVTFEDVDLTVTFWAVSPSGTAVYNNSGWGVRIYAGEDLVAQRQAGGGLPPAEPGVPARFDVTFENETLTTDGLRVQIDPFYINTDWPHTILYDSTDYPSQLSITPTGPDEADTTPPSAPANLTLDATGPTQAGISWEAATDDTGVETYKVHRGTSSDNLTVVGQTAGTSFLDGDLAPATSYHYAVSAVDEAGNEGQLTDPVEAPTDALGAERTFYLHNVGPERVQFMNELDTPRDNDGSGYNVLGGALATAQQQTDTTVFAIRDTFPADRPANHLMVLDPTQDIDATIYVQTDVAPASELTLRLTLAADGETIATGTSQVLASSQTWTPATFTLDHDATTVHRGALSATIELERGPSGFVFGYEDDHASNITLPEDTSRPLAIEAIVETEGTLAAGQETGFSATTVGGQEPVDITWSFGDGGTATGDTVNHTYAEPGRYDVTATATDGTGSTAHHTVPVQIRQADFNQDRVVVAVVDTGINPYHEAFQRPGADLPLSSFENSLDNATPRVVDLSDTGTWEQRVDADASIFDGIASQELIHFSGTNALGISFDSDGQEPILDRHGHGTATSSTVLAAHPDAIIVHVQTTNIALTDAIGWAADQPWIDVLSVSWGALGNVPLGGETPDHTRNAYDHGKVPVVSSGNDPSPLPTDSTDGPWWVLSITGSQEGGESKETLSSNIYPDYVSNYTVIAAAHDSIDGEIRTGGTSFSAPTVAGTVAGIVHELRVDAGHSTGIVGGEIAPDVTNADIRAALNKTASLEAYDGYLAGLNWNGDHTHPPGAPWTTAQWGQVDARTIGPAVQAIQTGELDVPEEKSEVALYKQTTFDIRQAYWG